MFDIKMKVTTSSPTDSLPGGASKRHNSHFPWKKVKATLLGMAFAFLLFRWTHSPLKYLERVAFERKPGPASPPPAREAEMELRDPRIAILDNSDVGDHDGA